MSSLAYRALPVRAPSRRRARIVLLALLAVLATALLTIPAGVTGQLAASRHDAGRALDAGVPLAAEGAVSSALGRDDRAYWVHDFHGANPAVGLRMAFSPAGVRITSGDARLSLSLAAVGRGRSVRRVTASRPRIRDNRVLYGDSGAAEFYANGPYGLEQGFVLNHRPAGTGDEVRISSSLRGNVRATISHGSIVLARPGTVLHYTGLVATDATGRRLAASMSLRAGRIVLTVDDGDARYPVRVDPFVQKAELTASTGSDEDRLGDSVAVSGNTIVAGAPGENSTVPGAVYVFSEPSGGWANAHQTAVLTVSDGATNAALGSSVAISGDTIVAGAPEATIDGHSYQGAAYVWQRPASGWTNATQTAALTSSDGATDDYFGSSVAIAGTTIVVGAPYHTVGSTSYEGQVYVYERPASGWSSATQTATLDAPDGTSGLDLGGTVAISADGATIAAGAYGYGGTSETDGYEGAVYVFQRSGSAWTSGVQPAVLTASDAGQGTSLGDTLAMSADGKTIVAGGSGYAPSSSNSGVPLGAVFVFVEPNDGKWVTTSHEAALLTSDETYNSGLGAGVAIIGTTIYALADDDGETDNGDMSLYAYTEPSTGWADHAEPLTSTTPVPADDGVDFPIKASGDLVILGAAGEIGSGSEGQTGAVFLLQNPATFPTPTITKISPDHGPTSGGTAVTITGTNFTGASSVTFAGVAAKSFSVVSSTEITATSPAAAKSVVDVSVTTDDGSSPVVPTDRFTYAPGGSGPSGVPVNTVLPAITGTPKAGEPLSCSHGSWTEDPSRYSYTWAYDGTLVRGATKASYRVSRSDEGLSVTCTVIAANAIGAGSPATSRPVEVKVPTIKGCPAATGGLSGTHLGPARLGVTRAKILRAFARTKTRRKRYELFFCFTPHGLRIGLGSPRLPAKYRDRTVWISTSSAYYDVHGIRVGATVLAAKEHARLIGPYRVGKNDWYFTSNGASNGIFKVRHDVIQEVGIAEKSLTDTPTKQRIFVHSFG